MNVLLVLLVLPQLLLAAQAKEKITGKWLIARVQAGTHLIQPMNGVRTNLAFMGSGKSYGVAFENSQYQVRLSNGDAIKSKELTIDDEINEQQKGTKPRTAYLELIRKVKASELPDLTTYVAGKKAIQMTGLNDLEFFKNRHNAFIILAFNKDFKEYKSDNMLPEGFCSEGKTCEVYLILEDDKAYIEAEGHAKREIHQLVAVMQEKTFSWKALFGDKH